MTAQALSRSSFYAARSPPAYCTISTLCSGHASQGPWNIRKLEVSQSQMTFELPPLRSHGAYRALDHFFGGRGARVN